MPALTRNRTWRRLGFVGGLFPVFLGFLLVGFRLFGPPGHWTDSVAWKPLRVKVDARGSALAYREELRRKWQQTDQPEGIPALAGNFQGRPILYEARSEQGIELLRTAERRLYIRRDGRWNELSVPPEFIVDDACLALRDDEVVVMASRWNSWWPYKDNYGRFFKSFFIPELRPVRGVYELALPGREPKYLFPGHWLEPSPDGRRIAFLRSAGDGSHSLHVLDMPTYEVSTLASFSEGDPGSGISFDYVWSADSRALGLRGWLSGHDDDVELIYTFDSESFWDVKAATTGSST